MKNKTSWMIVSIILFTGCYGICQQYYPLVETNKVWSISYYYVSPPNRIKYIKFQGDTLIGAYSYKIIFQTSDSIQYGWTNYGYIRETNDHKVFSLSTSIGTEFLLYDFNLMLHDTAYLRNLPNPFIADTVDSVQVVTGEWRKRIIVKTSEGGCRDTWIEGIGSLFGVMESVEDCMIGETSELVCMLQNETLVYHDPNYTNCDIPLKVTTLEPEDLLMIYPNPAKNYFVVDYDLSAKSGSNASLKVYSSFGKLLTDEPLIIGKTEISINTEKWTAGLYLLTLVIDGNVIESYKISITK
jgi:hypothetical protein